MLGSSTRDLFGNDPFFSDVNSEMRRMNDHFGQIFGGFSGMRGSQPALEHGAQRRGEARRRGSTSSTPQGALQPFSDNWMSNPFGMMDAMMSNMQQSIAAAQQRASDPQSGVHSFSSSSFYSYSSDGRSEPRMVEAHTAERRAPGGVRETRRAYRDSETGVAKMAIGHHLDDRAHIVERSENRRTGQREQRNEFHGFDEADAGRFDHEWQQRAHQVTRDFRDRQLGHGSRKNSDMQQRALEQRPSGNRNERERK